MFEDLGMGGGTFIILCIVGYFLMKGAVKNGNIEAFRKMGYHFESNQLSTVLAHCVGKQCMIYTTSPITLAVGEDLDKLWKVKCEITEVDSYWIRIQYEEKNHMLEKVIRVNQLKSVDILS